VEVRRFEWRRLGFGIVLLLSLSFYKFRLRLSAELVVRANLRPQGSQFAPAIIDRFVVTSAIPLIAILPTDGTDTLARFAAD
jgi:hypothetical protein